jgi:hypothetical protein
MEQGSFKYKTEHYFGSTKNVHTVSWKGRGEVDGDEIRKWCIEKFGEPGYRDDLGETLWLDNIDEHGEVFLCKDEYLTFFLLKWT